MKKRYALLFSSLLSILIILTSTHYLIAGTTGKVRGIITDGTTGQPLIGANIILENTFLGAAANLKGEYYIINVPPGIYTIRATMMGYKSLRIQNVRVSVDLTTTINISMNPAVVETGKSVTIVAKREMVVKDLTASTAVVDAAAMRSLPISEVSEAVQLQAGIVRDAGGGLHVRGGRSGEVSYWIDGVPVTDVYDGSSVVEVNKDMVQELQVVSGAFNAEYGQAMSGIVNITTKQGNNKFGGSFTSYIGDHISSHESIFMGINDINPLALKNIEASIHGPIVKDKIFFYVNARSYRSDGWLYGKRKYNPEASTIAMQGINGDWLEENAPDYFASSKVTDPVNNLRGFQYILGTNRQIDSLVTWQMLPDSKRTVPDSFYTYYNMLRNNHKNGKGDGAYVPMNWNKKFYAQAKLIYRITPSLRLTYNFIYDNVRYNDYERDFLLNPDGATSKFRVGETHIVQLVHTISNRTFYKIAFSHYTKGFKRYLYEDMHDPGYVHPDFSLQQAYSFKTGGTSNTNFQRETGTSVLKGDLTSQITNTHQIKTGVEYRVYKVSQQDISLRPSVNQSQIDLVFDNPYIKTRVMPDSTIYSSRYVHHPKAISAYIQDKMEFKDMIVNIGVRFDYFSPDGVVLNDESDPTITNPIRAENRYHDWGSDGVPNTHDADGTEGNGIWDAGEPAVTISERENYWYGKAKSKFQVSPRIGFSFPITEGGVIHFSYGHFFQVPRFELLYQNPDFELGSGTGNVGIIGNADLEPEQTISGELGIQQMLSDDIALSLTGYFRDVRNLTGTRAKEIVLFGGAAKYSKFINSDFGFIRGIVVALDKRFSNKFSASVDYTMQIAKGTNSDPDQARNALAGGTLPEVQLTSLNWDQKHTVNASFSYSDKNWGFSLLGQWGSGFPYTPRATTDISTLLTNSERKPGTYNVDLRAYRDFKIGSGKLTLFMRIFNLFDTLNELNVYNDTGRAGFTTDELTAASTNPSQYINSLNQWFTNAAFYSQPRRVEIGFTYSF